MNCVMYFVYTRLAMHYNKVANRCIRRSNHCIQKMEEYKEKLKGDVNDGKGTVEGVAEAACAD